MEVNLKVEWEIEVTRCDKGFVESRRALLHDVRRCLVPPREIWCHAQVSRWKKMEVTCDVIAPEEVIVP